jgi:hypothetical protein
MAVKPTDLERALHELIDALDRRVPHMERVGEASIASDAARLRAAAVKRLEELGERERPNTASDTPSDIVAAESDD